MISAIIRGASVLCHSPERAITKENKLVVFFATEDRENTEKRRNSLYFLTNKLASETSAISVAQSTFCSGQYKNESFQPGGYERGMPGDHLGGHGGSALPLL
ncbi:MAG TPA: hypothetical protein DCO77_02085 [Nitrospiraceae bacterium]|nr:hypothetical protein [Nitrospiraceae bacterium]